MIKSGRGAIRRRCAVLGSVVAAMLLAGTVPAAEPAAQPVQPSRTLNIGFRTVPDPPRSGPNSVEVTLRRADGAVVNNAQVTVVYYMPAMPAMNMPEMKTSLTLEPAGKGLYRGSGSLVMGGTWSVTITATQAGKPLGVRKLSVIAK